MKLHYRVVVRMVSGNSYTTILHTIEGAPDVTDPQLLRSAVEKQIAETWVGGGGLFDLGPHTGAGEISLATRHIESIACVWLPTAGTEQPPAEAGGISADYADSAE